MNCGNFRCNNALDIAFDLNDRNTQASGKAARQREQVQTISNATRKRVFGWRRKRPRLDSRRVLFCFWIE
ncbi:hypothetical protein B5V03_00290 [Bradyrhizobium betae]|jgi:hypothetical protein|uniref:Uncharacterized protein n=1 Tax=Bradyrhizobium betae TaxID=244734 RepID=A0A4Q1VN38_9BRAD|nr:hypothetical protein B5V03_00290 [Bradyrhizobium betae]